MDTDEHPRADTTLAALTKLKPIVSESGRVTAGNASGINDGACALLIASAVAAKANGLTPRARVVAMATAGVEPRIMGFGPAPAMRKVLALAKGCGNCQYPIFGRHWRAHCVVVSRLCGQPHGTRHA